MTTKGRDMIHSMTAYASRTGGLGHVTWVWELRSVNARGLDIRLRLPDGLAALEAPLRKALKETLHRGTVNLSLRLTRNEAAQEMQLDPVQLDRVLEALELVQDKAMAKGVTLGQPTAADVLGQRGVILQGEAQGDDTALSTALQSDVAPLIADFVAMRSSEGAALLTVLTDQITQIDQLTAAAIDAVEARKPETRKALRAAFARVTDDVTDADEVRLAQELALLAVKQDVTEELDRLSAHIKAARSMLEATGPSGRKLDFLSQEFNREANTLCSKAQNTALTSIGLELKAVIDQMREQIQNVE